MNLGKIREVTYCGTIRQLSLIGMCGRRLHYNIEVDKPEFGYWGFCVGLDAQAVVPLNEPECVECLTTVCSLLKKGKITDAPHER
jgi:hypothetical protein